MKTQVFRSLLYRWKEENPRDLPWLNSKNPYFIWLSEIILQQTRAAQGIPYYLHFIEKYPNVHVLANAPLDSILKSWEGLGYYSRARNLHQTAKYISAQCHGIFPQSYEELLRLKGVGPYTAAAISSFAFGEPKAVMDGNVIRFFTRLFALDIDIQLAAEKNNLQSLVTFYLDVKKPALFNQAIMDFGALVCVPKNPNCIQCPFQGYCIAYLTQRINDFPIKKPKPKNAKRFFHYFLLSDAAGHYLIQRRNEKDIWAGLHEFPLIETKSMSKPSAKKIEEFFIDIPIKLKYRTEKFNRIWQFKQVLSHQDIFTNIYLVDYQIKENPNKERYLLVVKENFKNFAFAKTINVFLDKFLSL